MTRDDIVIICGDFGIWHDDAEERYWLKWLNDKPFTTIFVDGNHENFDRLYGNEFPIVDFHGGKAHQIRKYIYHLMRGYIFEFEGKKFWCFGGASSHDIADGILDYDDYADKEALINDIKWMNLQGKQFRVNHLSWWKQELPSKEEMEFGLKTLEENGNKVDYIITHCCPQCVATMMGYRGPDIETQFFNEVAARVDFKRWFFGHLHQNRAVMSKYVCLYEKIERLL